VGQLRARRAGRPGGAGRRGPLSRPGAAVADD
jgi:hypothetical protein